MPPTALPAIINASHQIAWTVFRFGPSYPQTFPDGQFPVEAVEELYKQMIPDLNALLPSPNPTWTNMAALAVRLKGAVLMGHSESGFFPRAGRAHRSERHPRHDLDRAAVPGRAHGRRRCRTLAKIPTLIMFGDHLGDVQGGPANWAASLQSCEQLAARMKAAGGDVEVMHLPKMGIKGNSHMLMQDRNNLDLADLDPAVDRSPRRDACGHPTG